VSKLIETLELLAKEHRESMDVDVLRAWARDAAGAMREAAALARRVEGAAVGRVPRSKIGDMLLFPVSHDLAGKRVRLVPEGD